MKSPSEYADNVEADIKAALAEKKLPSLNALMSPIGKMMQNNFSFNGGAFSANAASSLTATGLGNPVLELVNFGDAISTTMISLFFAIQTGLAIVAGFGGGIVDDVLTFGTFDVGVAVSTFTSGITPFLTLITVSTVTAAFTMSVYLPMMPMVLWTMAVCGYIVLILESMVAAPIWAIMHASPEGHEWSGKGAAGYMIIMGVVLRPTLMIFGLVGAMILVNVLILLMKIMFSYAAGLVAIEANVGPIAMIVMFIIYVWLSIKIVHRSLDMINEIPSSIMKWIGGGHDALGDNTASEGNSFVGSVANKGEGAAMAGLASMGGRKNLGKATGELAATKAESQKTNQQLGAAEAVQNDTPINTSAPNGSKSK